MTAWNMREPHERKKEKTMSRTFRLLLQTYPSLRGRRSKGKGKGKGRKNTREGGGRREEGGRGFPFLSFLPRAAHALSRAQISPSPFNACHAG